MYGVCNRYAKQRGIPRGARCNNECVIHLNRFVKRTRGTHGAKRLLYEYLSRVIFYFRKCELFKVRRKKPAIFLGKKKLLFLHVIHTVILPCLALTLVAMADFSSSTFCFSLEENLISVLISELLKFQRKESLVSN